MSTVLIVLLFLLNTLLMPLVVELIKERAVGLAQRVIRFAVRLLPRAHRDRYSEEWTAELDEMERQNVSQLVSSLWILLSAPSMGRVLRVQDRRQLLVKGGHERLTGGVKVVRKILITSLVGGMTYYVTDLSNQPQIWGITFAVFIGGISLITQFISDFEKRLENVEEKQAAQLTENLTEIRLLIKEEFAGTNDFMERFRTAEVSALQPLSLDHADRPGKQTPPDAEVSHTPTT
jgi:hypothetical protein